MSLISTRYGNFKIIEKDSIISDSLMRYGEWAQKEIDLISQFIKLGSVVVDAGAFIGTHTRAFSILVGETGMVLAFEPRHFAGNILKENIKLSNKKNIRIVQSGLGCVEKKISVDKINNDEINNFGALRLDLFHNRVSLEENVVINTLDTFNIEKLDFIKIDVEGMEYDVLIGANKTIDHCRPIIFAECNSLEASSPLIEWSKKSKYQIFGVLSPAYNRQNYAGNSENVFGDAAETGMLLIPEEKYLHHEEIIYKNNLPKIVSIDDLALLMLHKPQYFNELFEQRLSKENLNLSYPSKRSDMIYQSVFDRDGQIINLRQSLSDRDGQIINLRQSLSDRDSQIVNLKQILSDRDGKIIELKNEIESFLSSTSWRVTKPIRKLSHLRIRFIQIYKIFCRYKKLFPGFKGFIRLFRKLIKFLISGGIKGLKQAILLHDNHHSNPKSLITKFNSKHSVLMLKDFPSINFLHPLDVAVHVHIYYLGIAKETYLYLKNIPVKFHLYITTDSLEKKEKIENIFMDLRNVLTFEIHVTENRGRDIFPMVVTLANKLSKHEFVLHIHTKCSPHNTFLLSGWRRYLFESLIGNPNRVMSILQEFKNDEKLGIFFPEYHDSIRQFVYKYDQENNKNIEKLLLRLGKSKKEIYKFDSTFFPAGNMFWLRGEVFKSLSHLNLKGKDFEEEMGQVNNTLAHAIERLFPYFANQVGLNSKAFLAESFLSSNCTAHKFSLFKVVVSSTKCNTV